MGERGFVIQQFDKASPKGMPHTAWEVKCLIKLLHNDYCPYYDRVLAYIFLREMHYIARGVTENIRDHAMRFIMDPGVYDPDFMPNFTTTTDLLPRMADPGKPPGLPNLGADSALNINEMARYVALYGRPGPNFYTGVVVDYAYHVNRCSVFGYGLSKALGPKTKAFLFRRYSAILFLLPRWYQEAIEGHNSQHPSDPFVPQTGPTFTITRLLDDGAANMNLQTIIDHFVYNRIPPSWVDHGYTYGINYINYQYSGSPYVTFFDEMDNKRLAQVRAYGVPPAIPEWDGWRHPTDEDIQRIRQLNANRVSREAPGFDHRRERGWTRVGEDRIFLYLQDRVEASAVCYSELHPIQLPSYPTLDTPTMQPGPADTNMSADGTVDPNLSMGDPTPMEVETSVNTEVSPRTTIGATGTEGGESTATIGDTDMVPPSG